MRAQRVGQLVAPQPTFAQQLEEHLSWQRAQLHSANSSSQRFLVFSPRPRWLVCAPRGKPPCVSLSGRAKFAPKKYQGHWDDVVNNLAHNHSFKVAAHHSSTEYSRKGQLMGLGNIMSGLVSAAAVAMLSKRILLVENWTTASHSLQGSILDLLLETSGFEQNLLRAQDNGSRLDSFLAHDDYSLAGSLCSANLLIYPPQRAWRIFSDQYFLPLLFLNPHHRKELTLLGVGKGWTPNTSPIWGPALSLLLRPRPALVDAANVGAATVLRPRGNEYVMSVHMRCVVSDGRCRRAMVNRAADCALQRLAARKSPSRIFIAAMHHVHRTWCAERIANVSNGTIPVLWTGTAVEFQETTNEHEDARLIDLQLLARADELLIPDFSSFGYMARGLAAGKPATLYQGNYPPCYELPEQATEPFLHMSRQIRESRSHGRTCSRGVAEDGVNGFDAPVVRLNATRIIDATIQLLGMGMSWNISRYRLYRNPSPTPLEHREGSLRGSPRA